MMISTRVDCYAHGIGGNESISVMRGPGWEPSDGINSSSHSDEFGTGLPNGIQVGIK